MLWVGIYLNYYAESLSSVQNPQPLIKNLLRGPSLFSFGAAVLTLPAPLPVIADHLI